MATHDYVIDNSTGANVRADINSVLQAILTNNSSSSAPSTTAAYMFWADTTSGTLKIRNSSDNAWVELLQLDGTLTLEDGAVGTPALAFRDDLDTGIYSSAANTFNVATGGVERMELGTTTVFNEDGADVDFRIEGDTENNLFYVDAGNDQIGIGVTIPRQKLHIGGSDSGSVNMVFTNSTTGNSAGDGFIVGITGGEDAQLNMQESANLKFSTADTERMRIDSSGRVLIGTTTEGFASFGDTVTIATSADTGITVRSGTSNRGSIFFSDATSGDAEKEGFVQYNHSDGRLVFGTTQTERVRIDGSGNVGIGTTSPANALDVQGGASNTAIVARSTDDKAQISFVDNNTTGVGSVVVGCTGNELFFASGAGGSEGVRLDGSSRFMINMSTSVTGGKFQVNNQFNTFFAAVNDATGVHLQLEKTRSTSPGSYTIVQDGDVLGNIEFKGSNGSASVIGAKILAKVNGTPGSGNDIPTDLIFRMQPDGSGSTQEAMRIRSDRTVEIATEGAIAGFSSSHVTGSGAPLKIYKSDGSTHAGLQLIWDHFNTTAGIKQKIQFTIGDDASSDGFNNAGYIAIEKADSWQSGSGRSAALVFATVSAATESERMRILSNGNVLIGASNQISRAQPMLLQVGDGENSFSIQRNNGSNVLELVTEVGTTTGRTVHNFENPNGFIGSIQLSGSSTSFNTSSDYRLKENEVAISDGITRLKTLKPYRFNFKADPSTILDGFFAHEVTAVPEAIKGTKDEVDNNGNPVHQGLDYGRITPLLTAALQEAITKIEVLETKVAALEAA